MKMELKKEISYELVKKSILNPYVDILNSLEDVYIFGAKELGTIYSKIFLEQGYKLSGFIDNDKTKQGQYINGAKVFSPDDLDLSSEKMVIVVASSHYFSEISSQLKNAGAKKILPCFILPLFNEAFPPEGFMKGLIEDFCINNNKYGALFNLFGDEKSKKVLKNLMEFRQTYDMNLFKEINDGVQKQYFENFIPYNGEPFIDGGAFDGDTIKSFLAFSNEKYDKIYFFEPDEKSFDAAKINLAQYPNIEFYQNGLSDCKKTLNFDAKGTWSSFFSEDGQKKIECISLDDTVKEDKVFIKLDIEGAEVDTLMGAKRLIANNSILAVCVYHQSNHIWQIPEVILNLNPNYKFYLRHYTNFFSETVLYAIPQSQ